MGNCMVSVDCHDRKDMEIFNKLFLSSGTIAALFGVFNSIDVDGSGKISVTEFLVMNNMERTPLITLILGSFDSKTKKKVIPFSQLSKHYHSVHGNLKGDVRLIAPLSAIEAKCGDSGISADLFVAICKEYPAICAPLVPLQFNFKDKILGVSFWNGLCQRRCRQDAPELLDPSFAYDLVVARRCEINIMSAEILQKRIDSAQNSLVRRMSVQIADKISRKKKSSKHSVRKRETKVGHAARRLSTHILPGRPSQIETVVPRHIAEGGKPSTKKTRKNKVTDVERRYGYLEGDPDEYPEDIAPTTNVCDGSDSLDGDNRDGEHQDNKVRANMSPHNRKSMKKLKSSDSKGENVKKLPKSTSKQIHPEESADFEFEKTGDVKKQKSDKKKKTSSKLTRTVRRMSESLASSVTNLSKKKGSRKDRSKDYITN